MKQINRLDRLGYPVVGIDSTYRRIDDGELVNGASLGGHPVGTITIIEITHATLRREIRLATTKLPILSVIGLLQQIIRVCLYQLAYIARDPSGDLVPHAAPRSVSLLSACTIANGSSHVSLSFIRVGRRDARDQMHLLFRASVR